MDDAQDSIFHNRRIAVTGASGGLGSALLRALLSRGANAERILRNQQWDPADYEMVFLNAGFGMLQRADSGFLPDVQEMFELNVLTTLELAQQALASGALHVHVVGSVVSHVSAPHLALYSASKHAVRGWAYGVARELPGRVSISYPNGMQTAFFDSLQGETDLLQTAAESFSAAMSSYDLPCDVAEGILDGISMAAREIIPTCFALDWFLANEVDIRRMWHPGLAHPSLEKWDWWEDVRQHWDGLLVGRLHP